MSHKKYELTQDRVFDKRALITMTSPIKHILKNLVNALFNVAPERESEFLTSFPKLTLKLTDEASARAFACPDEHYVEISRGIAEFCWCAAYTYPMLYDFIAPQCGPGKQAVIDLSANDSIRDAISLMKWCYRNITGSEEIPWPDNLPQPEVLPDDIDPFNPLNIAQEFGLISLACITLHELGHIYLGHKPIKGVDRIEQEREADRFAFDWILGDPDIPQKRFMKRSISVAIGLIAFVATEIHQSRKSGTHPKWFDRFYAFAEEYFHDEPNNIIWGIAVIFLKMHLDDASIPVSAEIVGTMRDATNEYLDVFSQYLQDHHFC